LLGRYRPRTLLPLAFGDLSSSDAVLRAIAEFDSLGREKFLEKYGFGPSRDYFLVVDGRSYDSKAIVAAAHHHQFPEEALLKWDDFNGGRPTISKLESLGFRVKRGHEGERGLSAVLGVAMEELQSPDVASVDRLRKLITVSGPAALKKLAGGERTVNGGIGFGSIAEVPWMSVYPKGSGASAQSGFYLAYLFAADGSRVYLSLNQGTDKVRGGLKAIEKRAIDLRAAAGLPSPGRQPIDLRSSATRPRKYEAGSAEAAEYSAGAVPSDEQLRVDLDRFLQLLDTAAASGLKFDPEVEPVHLLLKWSTDLETQTVELHEQVARSKGSVWWGRFGQGASPISAARLGLLQRQIERHLPTYAFLYGGGTTVRTRVQDVTVDPDAVDADRLPGYYGKDQCNMFVRLSDFEALDAGWLQEHVVLASDPDRSKTQGALGNQTTVCYTRRAADTD
jgi:hypothetical protein